MTTASMRAMSPRTWGPPEVLQEIRVPVPRPRVGEVLVRVMAAGINPTDWISRANGGRRLWDDPPILGFDVAGIVAEVADGSVLFRPGDRVFGMPCFPYQAGAYAEYVSAPARHFALIPDDLDFVHAGALPLAGLTAWQALAEAARIQPGQRILIHAAAGGVGHLAVQIARSREAYVIGTAQRHNHDFLLGLGANEVIDYTENPGFSGLQPVDVVIDAMGGNNGLSSVELLRPGGLLISLIPRIHKPTVAAAERAGVRYCRIVVEPDRPGLLNLARLVEDGRLRPEVAHVLPLAEAAEAHRIGELGHTRGKIVLTP